MKQLICFMLALLLMLAPTACGQKPADAGKSVLPQEAAAGKYTAENEIFTYDRVDPEKTQLVVSRTGNIPVEGLCAVFEEQNPDVQVIYLDITGGNSACVPVIDWVKNGCAPDVMISAADFFNDADTEAYFENLSADPLIENYEADALQRTATNANIYWLPGPSDINCMLYNKTLFEQYGWEPPATFDEFVALCLKIREDTNGTVEPWNPNAKYSNELLTAIEGFTYGEIFGGVENRSWYNDFCEGKATFAGHMEPYYEVLQTLIDNGLLREEHFTYSATTRGKEFLEGKIAMVNMGASSMKSDLYEFGFMPFPTTQGDLGYINDKYNCFVGIPKQKHTEAQADAIKRFIGFFSSPEGQQAYIGSSLRISNVKGTPISQSDALESLQPAVNAGHLFAAFDFGSTLGANNFSLHQHALDLATGAKTAAQCISEVDEKPFVPAESRRTEVLATAAQNMTVLETSFYIADMYRETAGADIALIANNAEFRGNLMRIFAGDLTPGFVTVLKPRSFANDSALVKLSMTGAQLMDALNHPLGNDKTEDCIYAFSGLKCTVAPWNALGEKYLSVTLADGTELEPNKDYTVAAWAGSVADEYITETLETFEGSWEELMTAAMKADGTVAPADDGRITLKWE